MQRPGFLGEETNIKKKENKLVLHSLKIAVFSYNIF